MIQPVNSKNFIAFSAKEDNKGYTHDTLLKNNFATRTKIGIDKFVNALTVYPAKGLKGSKNSNFYEFLTLGMVPYLVGSATLMGVFNLANKYYSNFSRTKASMNGRKFALGVLFYGLMKNISKSFISRPLKLISGVDIEQPYAKVIYELPDDINDTDITSIEHHKVFESVDFPRWDLFYTDDYNHKNRNLIYDRYAFKLGLGRNLNDSDQEVKPRVKEIAVKASLAKSISSYLWAAVGVAFAFQSPWEKYLNIMTFNPKDKEKFLKSVKAFGTSFLESAKTLYKGENGSKYSGRILLFTAAASTVLGLVNTLHSSHSVNDNGNEIFKKGEKYVKA